MERRSALFPKRPESAVFNATSISDSSRASAELVEVCLRSDDGKPLNDIKPRVRQKKSFFRKTRGKASTRSATGCPDLESARQARDGSVHL